MNGLINNIVEKVTQCWGCGVFDNMFGVVSNAGTLLYDKISGICFTLFAVLFGFYVIWVVWRHVTPNKPITDDPYYTKSVIRVAINSLIALAILGMGIAVPRFVSRVAFEPVADVALVYTQAMIQTSPDYVDEHVQYTPKPMEDTGLYRPKLRNTIIDLLKTTVTQFQTYMKLGIAVIDAAISWNAFRGVGAILRHLLMLFVGGYLFYGFGKLFVKFCFYFVDVIIAMAMFAFLFPIGLMMMSFRGSNLPSWMSTLGRGIGTDQIKKLINAIVGMGAAVITYSILMVIIGEFFSESGTSVDAIMDAITSGKIFEDDISSDNLESLTLGGTVVLLYVLNFLYGQIPTVKKMILSVFHVSEENGLNEQVAKDTESLLNIVTNSAKKIGSNIVDGITGGGAKSGGTTK